MAKKKVSEMNIDEFMEHGFDSDIDDDEVIQEKKKNKKKKTNSKKSKETAERKKSEASSHKVQLGNLKDKDPEFYKFLQENDSGLLEFSASEDEDDDNSDENQSDSDDQHEKTIESDDDHNDDLSKSDEETHDEESQKEKEKLQKIVSHDMIKEWKMQLEKDSIKTLKLVLAAFSSAVHDQSPDKAKDLDEGENKKIKTKKFKVDSGSMFNSLVAMSFKHSVRILEKHLDYNKKTKHKKKLLPSSSAKWTTVKASVRQYLFDILQLLRQLIEETVLCAVLHHCQSLVPYFATFPKLCKMFLKRLVRMWSTAHENVRVLSFILLRRTILLKPNLFEYLVKKMYLSFVRNSKFVTLKSKATLQFMENSLIEMYAMNHSIAYQHGFLYIRQLAINLRNAITAKKKESYQVVYNWQYVGCLQLWCRLVAEQCNDMLQPLIYPLVEITLGVIRLSSSVRYFPLRFICIKLLNLISEKTDVYIPTATNILEAIEAKEFNKKPSTTEKPPDFNVVLKLSKSQALSKGCQDMVIDLAFECILRHYVIYSHSIAFPELIFPICHRLKRLAKETKVVKLCRDMKTLLEKLQKHSDALSKERSLVTFAPRDIEKVREWQLARKEKKNTLKEFEDTWLAMKERISNEVSEISTEVSSPAKPSRKRKSTDIKDGKKIRDSVSDKKKFKGDDTVKNESAKKNVKKNSTEKAKHVSEEDILEEFKFSDSDSE